MSVTFTSTAGALVGELNLADRPSSARSIAGTRCEEVSGALALIASLALSAPVYQPRAPQPELRLRPEPSPEPSGRRRFSMGIAGSAALGPLPNGSVGFGLNVELAVDALAFRLGFHRTGRSETSGSGLADFVLLATELGVSAKLLERAPFAVFVGLEAVLGSIEAEGAGVTTTLAVRRFYGSAGPDVRLQLVTLDPVVFELDGSLGFPFLRDRYVFLGPEGAAVETIHEVAPMVGRAAFSMRVYFW